MNICILTMKMEDIIKRAPNLQLYELSAAEKAQYNHYNEEKSRLMCSLRICLRNDRNLDFFCHFHISFLFIFFCTVLFFSVQTAIGILPADLIESLRVSCLFFHDGHHLLLTGSLQSYFFFSSSAPLSFFKYTRIKC